VAGGRQTPGGSGFDPNPQFRVQEAEPSSIGLVVTGRCWFGPLLIGTVFDRLASFSDGCWTVIDQCQLRVDEIEFSHVLVDQLDQSCSARLVLQGPRPISLSSESLLVAFDAEGAKDWHRAADNLWHRRQP
jgi:hypothetical protein